MKTRKLIIGIMLLISFFVVSCDNESQNEQKESNSETIDYNDQSYEMYLLNGQ